ncbi:hypothetical protein KVP40.0030 [Vibrio phage KVP40]|uniref:Prepilin-type N-terminal cleavage/methylation domain-containing protein n=2 Tax=Schizotequatrovirus KVP40 TaxID=1914019 RepID=Q6WIC1_BPKVM|nr:hypothetical protein KVP40.0030 [Vibrio phage KVP40]QIW91005.1 hypothetical protein COHAPHLL_00142 [Vibrio phage V09]UNA01926.1 hypothetical protein [Vibrio phage PC-Liy1]URQ03223.1 hypothetical protein PVA8_237 [Vibrio phage PVA8]WBM58958.1 hypothetical protein vBValMPVA8_236 [Vibrio phage vB_ValM_PVA8]AAQ64101.1 hypothetical protein KVP40.0030 [Vibrio phage KVP40]
MKSKGFTLIELIVVIVILGVLASIGAGALGLGQTASYTTQSQSVTYEIDGQLMQCTPVQSAWDDDF